MPEISVLTPAEAIQAAAALAMGTSALESSPRGLRTREILFPQIKIYKPWCLPLNLGLLGRKLNPYIGAVEALQLVGQTSDPESVLQVSSFEQFAEYGIFHGSYGQRIYGQLHKVVEKLALDQDSRQAVVTIFEGHRDLGPVTHDVPCTLSIQFLVRHDTLIARTVMRSNDIWLGLPYDLIQFISLQGAVAAALGLRMGPYYHTAGSLHLYERNFDQVAGMTNVSTTWDYMPLWSPGTIGDISRRARLILSTGLVVENHDHPADLVQPTQHEEDLAAAIVRGPKRRSNGA